MPSMPLIARFTRLFLADAVRRLSESGVRQFLGEAMEPTVGNLVGYSGIARKL
jgi:hypothetical protein